MERRHNRSSVPTLALALTLLLPLSALAQGPRLQLDHLSKLAAQAKEAVDVSVDPPMLQQMAGLLAGKTGKDPALNALIAGVKGVYVKVFEFDRAGAYTDADVQAVRTQLKAPWARIVSVKEAKELIEVYMWPDGGESGGLAVIVAEPKELVIVNIVGRIDLKMLGALKGFGIPENLGELIAPQGSKPGTND